MSSTQPLWLQVVLRLERAIGEPVEHAVRSDAYFDAVTVLDRARRKALGAVEGASRRGLHLFNLPARTDIRRMRHQLTRLERRLNELGEDVAELEGRRRTPVE
jgi:hypothetical protein